MVLSYTSASLFLIGILWTISLRKDVEKDHYWGDQSYSQ